MQKKYWLHQLEQLDSIHEVGHQEQLRNDEIGQCEQIRVGQEKRRKVKEGIILKFILIMGNNKLEIPKLEI